MLEIRVKVAVITTALPAIIVDSRDTKSVPTGIGFAGIIGINHNIRSVANPENGERLHSIGNLPLYLASSVE